MNATEGAGVRDTCAWQSYCPSFCTGSSTHRKQQEQDGQEPLAFGSQAFSVLEAMRSCRKINQFEVGQPPDPGLFKADLVYTGYLDITVNSDISPLSFWKWTSLEDKLGHSSFRVKGVDERDNFALLLLALLSGFNASVP